MKKALLSVLLVLTLGATVHAWEADVHYGLTRWLAANAGFTPDAAERIAAANLSADQGSFDPATWAVGLHITILADVQASKHVQQLHFPSYGPVPGDPNQRTVTQSSVRAQDWLRKETQFMISPGNEEWALAEFGRALHSLQDSWSHEGEPDVAFRCFGITPRRQLSWAHPVERGGWAVHDADLTYFWQNDRNNRPIDMAHATFDALISYGRAHPSVQQKSPLQWSQLAAAVTKFIEAGTKDDKTAWFRQNGYIPFTAYRNQNFIDGLSLPTSSKALRAARVICNVSGDVVAEIRRVADQIPLAVRSFYDDFFKRWLIDRSIGATVDLIDMGEIGRELEGLGFRARADEWARKFLSMWLLDDHGFVNQNGHGVPTAEGFARLPLDPAGSVDVKPRAEFLSVDQAIIAPGTGNPYQLDAVEWPTVGGTAFVATFRFRNQVHDALVLVAKQVGQTIRVVRMLWVVE